MPLHPIALWAGLLPIICVHLTYLLAAYYGHVPWCMPYWDGCSSISATGRKAPEFFLFKAMMLPAAVVMMAYWKLMADWLGNLVDGRPTAISFIRILGIFATLSLILYTTMLGAEGKLYQVERRIGIILFFAFTALSHLLVIQQTAKVVRNRVHHGLLTFYRTQLGLSAVLLTGGVANSILAVSYSRFHDIEDAIEWSFALVMMSQFIATYFAWKRSGFRAELRVR